MMIFSWIIGISHFFHDGTGGSLKWTIRICISWQLEIETSEELVDYGSLKAIKIYSISGKTRPK